MIKKTNVQNVQKIVLIAQDVAPTNVYLVKLVLSNGVLTVSFQFRHAIRNNTQIIIPFPKHGAASRVMRVVLNALLKVEI